MEMHSDAQKEFELRTYVQKARTKKTLAAGKDDPKEFEEASVELSEAKKRLDEFLDGR
jgi:hypothetical protein